jgi:RNA polymerase sigma factor (sigma-70 family)
MADSPPPELVRLLEPTASDRESAWEAFLAVHYRLLLHVARSFAKEHDAAMDAFAWMLEGLRADDFHRLRAFSADGRSEFTTWLVVVGRRLCLDWYRAKYGRDRPSAAGTTTAGEERGVRRRLVDLVGDSVDTADLPQSMDDGPEADLRSAELTQVLQAALAELEPSDRLLLKLRFDDGLSGNDIAGFMQMPTPFHVYRRITALLDTLRRSLRSRGVEGPVP